MAAVPQSSTIVTERGPAAPAPLRLRLQAGLSVHPELRLSVRLGVADPHTPVRLFLYIDGDLVETWVTSDASWEMPAARVPAGRHVLTARAVDAFGRWAGASQTVEIPIPPATPEAAA